MIIARQIVERARTKIADPQHWIQHMLRREHPEFGTQFCAEGALLAASQEMHLSSADLIDAVSLFQPLIGLRGLAGYNDSHSHAEVLALFDRVLAQNDIRHFPPAPAGMEDALRLLYASYAQVPPMEPAPHAVPAPSEKARSDEREPVLV